ncbi:cucumber peeling cupredoxin-like [Cucurbita pepo subsp. pepo]|uniref:cucumber peeling cupredoxin-like n=1 Tax=Cucurbita pepo subsp. pepo TaxID=3664 RepID=UPI000C9D52CD|nr:cucumber peeling cupredoxin-like [Cucurbita pepo subsp. pepo]
MPTPTNNLAALLTAAFIVTTAAPFAGAETHHVVGGDRGWDVDSNIASWSAGRIFRVGDKIWFAYSVAHGNVVELARKEEYKACDVSRFIREYRDGIDIVALNGEGIRYFASSRAERCKKGLKLQVHVEAQQQKGETTGVGSRNDMSEGDGESAAVPPSPSTSSTPFAISYVTLSLLLAGLAFTYWIS